jgi:hypothetical protein
MSQDPLFKKLRILPRQDVLILHPPDGYLEALGDFPEDTRVATGISGQYDLVHAFFTHNRPLDDQIGQIKSALQEDGILWISYPKQSARQDTDLNRDILRRYLAGKGLKAVAQVSIDETWSALRFKRI